MIYTTKTTPLETWHIWQHDLFILRWSDLDYNAWIYKVEDKKYLMKFYDKDLLHQWFIPELVATKEWLRQTLLNEIEIYRRVNK